MLNVSFQNESLILLPEKAIYCPDYSTLLIADLHLGKANHFRKSGIPVPQNTNKSNLDRLILLIQKHAPDRVIFLGDLFHSHYNIEVEEFKNVLDSFAEISFELVQGNHDIMSPYQYEKLKIKVHKDQLNLGTFVLTHEPLEEEHQNYNLAGHIHPSVRLKGRGRQQLKFPCFYFGEHRGLLPAFGEFTGTHSLKPKPKDKIFIIVNDEVISV